MKLEQALMATLLLTALGGCGGGGGGGGGAGTAAGTGAPPAATCTPTMAHPLACNATMGMALLNASNIATTQLQPDSPGTLRVTLQEWDGRAVPNTVVSFSTTDSTGGFVPAAGTALTNAAGIASIGLPAGTRAGAFTVTASATVRGSTLTATTPYTVSFPTLALSALTVAPATLSAGGNASISVTVNSDGRPYNAPLPVSFSSPCASAGKAVLGSPVTTQAGVAIASYSDRGCGVADRITASVTLGDSVVQTSGVVNVLPASAGSIAFVASDTTNIALVGTGGIGRQEFARLTFKVFDSTGTAVSGAPVNFVFADSNASQTTGGLKLNPSSATTAADGTVSTQVANGTLPTSVRVKAMVNSTHITTLSNVLVVSTGVPDQRHFSLSSSNGNCEGWTLDQDECSTITVRMADHFGNPVPDGTAVNFSAEGGNIEASCITGVPAGGTTPTGQSTNSQPNPLAGTCSVKLRSADPRPPGGRVTVLAYALGEEDFTDLNGNNLCDNCDAASDAAGSEFSSTQDKRRDIYRDDDENLAYTPGEPCVGPNNGSCTTAGDGRYNGVLRNPLASGSTPTLYVSAQLVQLFSGSEAFITFEKDGKALDKLICPAGGTATVNYRIKDVNGNPMPAASQIQVQALFGTEGVPVIPASLAVNNYVLGVRSPTPEPLYEATVGCGAGSGTLIVTLTTPVRKVITTAKLPIN